MNCCHEYGCRRKTPLVIYFGDLSGQVYIATDTRLVNDHGNGRATFTATRKHDATDQMRKFIHAKCGLGSRCAGYSGGPVIRRYVPRAAVVAPWLACLAAPGPRRPSPPASSRQCGFPCEAARTRSARIGHRKLRAGFPLGPGPPSGL